ncbi:MAG: polyphosphate kinase 1, partial [Bacteroidota bacterium]
ELIRKLYAASKAGVKIKMLVRGICSLVPGIKGVSDNIEVHSIVDRYLEHSRIMVFCNGGDPRYFLSSADMMSRNLDHRSEVAVPVYDTEAQKMLDSYLRLQFDDNVKARVIEKSMRNRYFTNGPIKRIRSQVEFYKALKSINK